MVAVESSPVFLEEQRFNQPWLWIGLLGADIFAGVIIYFAGRTTNSQSDHLAMAIIAFVATVPPIVLLLLCILRIKVLQEELQLQFSPFHRKPRIYPFKEIRSVEAIKYSPLLECGGWGLRKNRDGDPIYSTSGDKAVRITFKDGKKLLIGSQRSEELARAITDFLR